MHAFLRVIINISGTQEYNLTALIEYVNICSE